MQELPATGGSARRKNITNLPRRSDTASAVFSRIFALINAYQANRVSTIYSRHCIVIVCMFCPFPLSFY